MKFLGGVTVDTPIHVPGDLKPTGATSADPGWLMCDGGAVSRTTYANLFAKVGTAYGVGNGTTTFNVPNLKGRTVVGEDSGATHLGTFNLRGQSGGAGTVALTTAQLASHSHGAGSLGADSAGSHHHTMAQRSNVVATGAANAANDGSGTGGPQQTDNAGAHTHTVSGSSGTAGSGSAHENMPPYSVANWMIKF